MPATLTVHQCDGLEDVAAEIIPELRERRLKEWTRAFAQKGKGPFAIAYEHGATLLFNSEELLLRFAGMNVNTQQALIDAVVGMRVRGSYDGVVVPVQWSARSVRAVQFEFGPSVISLRLV